MVGVMHDLIHFMSSFLEMAHLHAIDHHHVISSFLQNLARYSSHCVDILWLSSYLSDMKLITPIDYSPWEAFLPTGHKPVFNAPFALTIAVGHTLWSLPLLADSSPCTGMQKAHNRLLIVFILRCLAMHANFSVCCIPNIPWFIISFLYYEYSIGYYFSLCKYAKMHVRRTSLMF